jgi:hypothetical protein
MCNFLSLDIADTESLQLVVAYRTLCSTILNIVRLWQVIFKSEEIMPNQTLWVTYNSVIFLLLEDLLDRFAAPVNMWTVILTLIYK